MSYILLQMDVTRWLVGSNREKCNTFKVYKFFVFFSLNKFRNSNNSSIRKSFQFINK